MSEVAVNVVWRHLSQNDKPIVVEQGGTRSGKTYNILMWLIFAYSEANTGKIVTISRKTYNALRATAMRDFFEILETYDLYNPANHNKTNSEYTLNGNLFEFVGLDQAQKIRGRKRDVFYGNEANELTLDDWRQITFRTRGLRILDYNPSDEYHWLYTDVLTRDDVAFFKTTYKDNPFLEQSIIDEIERLKDTDPDYWRVFGLGERGTARNLVFASDVVSDLPKDDDGNVLANLIAYGLDFGFSNDPTAVVAVYEHEHTLYFDEVLYQTGLTGNDIATALASENIDRRKYIYCDTGGGGAVAMEDMRRRGLNVAAAKKGSGSIADGIDLMRQYKLRVTARSVNLTKEFRNYKYKTDRAGNITNEPLDLFNHGIDAARYVVFTAKGNPNQGVYHIS